MNPAHTHVKLQSLATGVAVGVLCLWLSACAGTAQPTSSNNGGGSQATTLLYVAAPQVAGTGNGMNSINAFRIGADGSLAPLGTALQGPTALRLGPTDANGHHVFGFQQSSPASIVTFAVQPDTGALQQTSVTPLPANKNVGSIAFNTARSLLAVSLGDPSTFVVDSIAIYSVDSAANLTLKSTTSLQVIDIAFSPSGSFLYVSTIDPATKLVALIQFAIAPDGSLGQVGPLVPVGLPGSSGLTVTPNGRAFYIENFSGPSFAVFLGDPATGNLTTGPIVGWPPFDFSIDEGDSPFVNQRGTLLMTSTSGESLTANGVALCTIDPNTGIPTPQPTSYIPIPGPGFPSYVWDDNGNFLYANAASSSEIQAFSVTDAGAVTRLSSQAVGFVRAVVNYQP